ncbi:MAG: peptidoglycan DD-metalloendopeptidase family protein [Bacteroidales bacterium]|nr:peptidoglycan DD-metalloendopeptidase family protein [Bacteroidales bacterium]
MPRKKKHIYRFNPHTLSYEKVIVTVRDRMKKISTTVLLGVVLGVVFLVVGFQVIDSPKERSLKREIRQYQRQLKSLNARMEQAGEVLEDIEKRDDNVYRAIFQAEPIGDAVRNSGIGGVERYSDLEGYDCSEAIIDASRRLDNITKRLYVQSRSIDEVYQMAVTKQQRLAAMPAIMPLPKNRCHMASGFGYRYHPILHTRRMHTGVDLTAAKGEPAYATADGVVRVAGRNVQGFSGYGVVVFIDHGYGFQTLYAHLSNVAVRPGQKVKRGEKIGYVGSTGLSQGSHLHYEVFQNGDRVNPIYFFFSDLTPEEYEEVIELANQENQCLS